MWEERWHPLREEWVIVAAHRQSRPWSGAEVAGAAARPPAFDPTATSAPATCASAARGTRATPASSCSTTTIRASGATRRASSRRRRRLPQPAAPTASRASSATAAHDLTLAELDVDGVDALLRDVAGAVSRARRAARGAARADLREQGRGRRRQQPAPALPDLRDELRLQVHRDGAARRPRGISTRRAARCSRTSSRPSSRTAGASSPSTDARSRSFRTSRATPTRRTSRRADAREHRGPGRRRAARSRDVLARRGSFGSTTSGRCRSRT